MSMFQRDRKSLWPFFSKLFIFGAFLYTLLGMWFHSGPVVMVIETLNREELYMGMSAVLLVMGIVSTALGNEKSE